MSDLPSFLSRDPSGRYVLTYSASGASAFSLCEAKFSWGYVAGIEGATARAGQNYGTGLHLALAHWYRCMLRDQDPGLSRDPVSTLAQCHDIIQRHFAENPQPELGGKGKPEWRTASRAIQAFDAYVAHYGAEDFEVLGVEEPFEVALGEFTVMRNGFDGPPNLTVEVKLRGIRDLRVRWHDQLWVLDHKTSTEWSDLAVDEGRASFQFMGYAWAERFLVKDAARCPKCGYTKDDADFHMDHRLCDGVIPSALPVGGVIGNYLISRPPYAEGRKATPRDLPRDQFHREPYPYSDAQLAEWHEDALALARSIFTRWQEGEWRRNRTACAHWGRCEFYRLCWETEASYREAAALGADYRPRTPSPFEEEANGKERS